MNSGNIPIPFPIIYFDGESETMLGTLELHPRLPTTTKIKNILNQRFGICPCQFSVFLVQQESRRKIPFSDKINLAALPLDRGVYYLYVQRENRCNCKMSLVKNKKFRRLRRDCAVDGMLLPAPALMVRDVLELRGKTACEECMRALLRRTVADFHLCVCDEVVIGFKSSAGPVSRPVKFSGKNCH